MAGQDLNGLAAALRGMSPENRHKLAQLVSGPPPKSDQELQKEAEARKKVKGDPVTCRVTRPFFRTLEARRYKRGALVQIPRPGSQEFFDEFRTDHLPGYLTALGQDEVLLERSRGQVAKPAKRYVRKNQVPEEVETASGLMAKQGAARTMSDRAG